MPVILLGGGHPGSAPNQVSGLVFWLDAAQGVYSDAGTTPANNNDTVQQWNDQSASAHHVSQGTAGSRPTYLTGQQNGNPILRFDATDDTMARTANNDDDLIVNNAMTAFVVWKPPGNNNKQKALRFFDGTNEIILVTNSTNAGSSTSLSSIHYDGSSDQALKSGLTLDAWFIQTWMHSGGNVYCGANDTRDASLASTASGNSSFGANTNIGIRAASTFVQSDIGEIAVFNVALTEAQRQSIETYLAWKWGITIPY